MLVEWEIVLEGLIFGKVNVKVKVTGLAVCLFLYSSQVFGPISMKLGGWMQVDQEIVLEGFIFGKVKVKVTGVKDKITVFPTFVPLFLPGFWSDLHQTWWVDAG